MKTALYWAASLFVFAAINWVIVSHQWIIDHGDTVYLQLVPIDPRSLMQGDYMRLRYAVTENLPEKLPRSGKLVLRKDGKQVATFVRVYEGGALSPGEFLLTYRKEGDGTRLGAESFFFQEGDWEKYSGAKYGELRVGRSGASALVGLRGENLEPLGPGVAARRTTP